jgi:hypothetical protein
MLPGGPPVHLVIPPGVRDGACVRLAGVICTGHVYINILLVP